MKLNNMKSPRGLIAATLCLLLALPAMVQAQTPESQAPETTPPELDALAPEGQTLAEEAQETPLREMLMAQNWFWRERQMLVSFTPCAEALCAAPAKARNSGKMVLRDLRPTPDGLSGKMMVPGAPTVYEAHIERAPDRAGDLLITACTLKGVLCRQTIWRPEGAAQHSPETPAELEAMSKPNPAAETPPSQ